MSLQLGIADCVVIALMLVISASTGVYFRFSGGRQRTTEEFLMAGKNMDIGPVAVSLMATYVSSITVLSIPAETYLYGTQLAMWMVASPIGALVAAYGCVPVFYDMQVSTAYEYLEKRFGKSTRTFVAFIFGIQMILLMAVGLYAPALALNAVTGLSTWVSILSLAFVCMFYCSLGGLKAVLWTDVFQAVLMYFAVIALIVQVMVVLGVSETMKIITEGDRLVLFNTSSDPTVRYTLWNSLLSGVVMSFHTFGANQSTVQRMISVGSIKKAQKTILLSLPFICACHFFTFVDGLAIYALFHDCDPMKDPSVSLEAPDQIVPYTLLKLFGAIPGLTGLCISGVFSASLSTISSAINALTAVTMDDFIRPFCSGKRVKESWMTAIAKLLAFGYGGITLLLVYFVSKFRSVMEASSVLSGLGVGTAVGTFFLGFFTKTANEKGTFIGLIAGIAVNSWLVFGSYVTRATVPTLSRSVEGCHVPSNMTFFNETLLGTAVSPQNILNVEDRYIFPPYKMSFVWFSLIGSATVIIVGYLASLILSFCIEVPEVKPENVSPFVRKLYFKSVNNTERERPGKDIDFERNGHGYTSLANVEQCQLKKQQEVKLRCKGYLQSSQL